MVLLLLTELCIARVQNCKKATISFVWLPTGLIFVKCCTGGFFRNLSGRFKSD